MVSTKTNESREEEKKVDDKLLDEKDLPHWMETDTLYFFRWEQPGDVSESILNISGRQMKLIEFAKNRDLEGKYNIQIEVDGKIYFLGLEFATIAQNWIDCLKRAKKSAEE